MAILYANEIKQYLETRLLYKSLSLPFLTPPALLKTVKI